MTKTFPILPDLACPDLAGYKLPSFSRCQEDDVYIDYPERPLGIQGIVDYQLGFQSGYTKAREKFEFSESDVILAIQMAKNSGYYLSEIIQSLRTPRTPIAIEVEMVEQFEMISGNHFIVPATNPDGTVKGRWVYE